MARHAKNLQGIKFGSLEVLYRDESNPLIRTNWFCKCLGCGFIRSVQSSHLSPNSKGCKRCSTKTHGMAGTSTYAIWNTMITRCENPNHDKFSYYGGRGIKVCQQWKRFSVFVDDMGVRPSLQHSIERRNGNGNYEPENCFWATKVQQARNTRSNRIIKAFGREQCLAAWAEETKINGECIRRRIYEYGWDIEEALSTPSRLSGKILTVRADGKRQWSLRSRDNGIDVSEVSKKYGGGGHAHASGYEDRP